MKDVHADQNLMLTRREGTNILKHVVSSCMNGSFLSLSLSDGVAAEPDAVGGRLDLA